MDDCNRVEKLSIAEIAEKGRGVREGEAGQLCHQSSTIDDPQSAIVNHNSLLHPIRDEDVGFVRSLGVAI